MPVWVCAHVCRLLWRTEEGLGFLELELQTVSRLTVLAQNSKGSSPRSHLSRPGDIDWLVGGREGWVCIIVRTCH